MAHHWFDVLEFVVFWQVFPICIPVLGDIFSEGDRKLEVNFE